MKDRAKELLTLGRDHFEGARILMDQGYPTDMIGLLFHEALEAYFKGLLAHWQLDSQDDESLKTLFDRIVQKEKAFKKFEDICERVSGYYVFGKLPADPLSDQAHLEMKATLAETEKLISLIDKQIYPPE